MRIKAKTRQNITIAALIIAAGLLATFLFNLPGGQGNKPVIKIYFFKDDNLSAVARPLDPAESQLKQSIVALLAGPDERERAEGLTTLIPAGVKLRYIKFAGDTAIINLSRELGNYGGGAAKVEGLVAQLVFTATEVPGVDKVWLWVEGEKKVVLGGEGFQLDRPLRRSDATY